MTQTKKKKTPVTPVQKPFLRGTPTDRDTLRRALMFFGTLIMIFFVSVIICSMTGFDSPILRILINGTIIALMMLIVYHTGESWGTEMVARGENLYQRREKGIEVSAEDARTCFHPAKAFIAGAIGTLPFVLLAIVLAVTAQRQMTTPGTLPSWMQTYARRNEIGDPLVNYLNPEGVGAMDMLRIAVRVCILPYINLVGNSDGAAMLWVERLSPLLLLLPAVSYGIGALQGTRVRTRIHTEIAENAKKRIRRENKARKKRMAARTPKAPEQLN
jgi:hypothetical protein